MVRDAVKDALLDVIGTVLLLGIAFVLVIARIQAVFSSLSPGTVTIGIGVVAVGVYLAAATLEIIPPNFERVKRTNVGQESVPTDELAELELGPNNCAAE